MRDLAAATWKLVADVAPEAVEFVVSLSDRGITARFCGRADEMNLEDDDGDAVDVMPGLLTDLDGICYEIDPRHPTNPLPSIPALSFAEEVISDIFGEFPQHPGILTAEVALVCAGLSWDDRIVIMTATRIDPSTIVHGADGSVELALLDPLAVGKVLVPQKAIDITKLPAAWTAANIQDDVHGKPYPICYGSIHRAEPLKVYDDGDDPITRRYILAGHSLSGSDATCHRRNAEIQDDAAGYSDFTETIATETTTDGFLFSYIETSGDEDPTLSPPAEVQAISFEATDGKLASLGAVIREMVQRWTDIEIDEELERSFGEIVEAFASIPVSVILNGEGVDRATVAEIVDQRFAPQFPVGTARVGGNLILVALHNLMRGPGPGYILPVADFRLGSECHLMDTIRETGEIQNHFECRYKRREDGRWESNLILGPDNDFNAQRSYTYYGRRERGSVDLEDVVANGTAAAILGYLRNVHYYPWYEAEVMAPHDFEHVTPGQKARLYYSGEDRIPDTCTRFRDTLDYDTSDEWRDAIVVRKAYRRTGLIFTVIF